MPWDDFARVGSPTADGPGVQALVLGESRFPPALRAALSRAGVHADAAQDLRDLEKMVRARKPDLLICAAAALGPDPEMAMDGLVQSGPKGTCPVILVSEERMISGGVPATTRFAEVLGSGQDALGCFLMVRATLRRKRPQVMTEVLEFGQMSLDQEKFVVSFGETRAPLNMLAFCILGAMLDAPRMVWNKVFLNRVVFGPVDAKPGRQFDTWMSLARRHIRSRIGVDPIASEHGLGYALSPTVLGVTDILARAGDG